MNVAELRAELAELPDDMPVVTPEVHPIQYDLADGEVDWYGGMETGTYASTWSVSVEEGRAVIR